MDPGRLKLGKRPPVKDSRDLTFRAFLTQPLRKFPKPPKRFGHERFTGRYGWGMLGNDEYGDCVFAGAAHEHMLWTAAHGGKPVEFTTENVLQDYSAVTGFRPNDPSTDNGTIMLDAMKYRRKVGIVDAKGRRHKIGAFLRIDEDNFSEMLIALYMFGVVAIGVEFPESCYEQMNENKAWRPVEGSRVVGGHYVPVVARRAMTDCVTWGQLQSFSSTFYAKYCDEAYVLLGKEFLKDGRTPNGFDLPALREAMTQFST